MRKYINIFFPRRFDETSYFSGQRQQNTQGGTAFSFLWKNPMTQHSTTRAQFRSSRSPLFPIRMEGYVHLYNERGADVDEAKGRQHNYIG